MQSNETKPELDQNISKLFQIYHGQVGRGNESAAAVLTLAHIFSGLDATVKEMRREVQIMRFEHDNQAIKIEKLRGVLMDVQGSSFSNPLVKKMLENAECQALFDKALKVMHEQFEADSNKGVTSAPAI